MFRELVKKNRSYRRFKEDKKIHRDTLWELVDLARLTPSARNKQPLKYYLSCDPDTNSKIFPCLGWAGYLKDWEGPGPGERPSGYIIVLGDTEISREFWWDFGIVSQTILLGAAEKGLGGCMIGTIDKALLRKSLNLESKLEILLVLALGEPDEKVVIEEIKDYKDIQYWRDDQGVHHVPKRHLKDIII